MRSGQGVAPGRSAEACFAGEQPEIASVRALPAPLPHVVRKSLRVDDICVDPSAIIPAISPGARLVRRSALLDRIDLSRAGIADSKSWSTAHPSITFRVRVFAGVEALEKSSGRMADDSFLQ